MEILIVHRDAEIGEQLVQMVKDYTTHECDLVGSDDAALDWGRRHARCRLLLAQLEAEGVDGLAAGAALSEIFAGLQTLFLPQYSASEQRLVVANTKVFPSPLMAKVCSKQSRVRKMQPRAHPTFFILPIFCTCAA